MSWIVFSWAKYDASLLPNIPIVIAIDVCVVVTTPGSLLPLGLTVEAFQKTWRKILSKKQQVVGTCFSFSVNHV